MKKGIHGFIRLVVACLCLGFYSFSLGDTPQAIGDDAMPGMEKVQRRDSWGFFEFLHYHSEAAKQKEAKSVIHDLIRLHLDQAGDTMSGNLDQASQELSGGMVLERQMEMVYGKLELIPTDCYRGAIQQVQDEDLAGIKQKYPKLDDWQINLVFLGYYDQGKGPATVTVDSVEKSKKAMDDLKNTAKQLQDMANSMKDGSYNNTKAAHAPKASEAMGTDNAQAEAPAPTAAPAKKDDAVGKAVGNALGDAAKNLGL